MWHCNQYVALKTGLLCKSIAITWMMTSTMISKVELMPVATVLYCNHDCRHQDDMKKIGWIHPFLHIILEQNSYSAAKNWISSFPQNSSDDLCLLFCINPSSLSVKWRAGNVRVCVCVCVCVKGYYACYSMRERERGHTFPTFLSSEFNWPTFPHVCLPLCTLRRKKDLFVLCCLTQP